MSNYRLISTYILNSNNIFNTFELDVPDTKFSNNECLFLMFKNTNFYSFKGITYSYNTLFNETISSKHTSTHVKITSKAIRLSFNFYISKECQLKGNLKHFRNYSLSSSVISSYNYDKMFFNCTKIQDIRRVKNRC